MKSSRSKKFRGKGKPRNKKNVVIKRDDTGSLRAYHNWIKRELIGNYCLSASVVLDAGCGKFGDMQKLLAKNVAFYTGLDISSSNIEEALRRREARGLDPAYYQFHVMSFTEPFNFNRTFDMIMCQFCIHFAMMSRSNWDTFLNNIRIHCGKGTTFIVTSMNGQRIVNELINGPILIKDNDGNLKFSIEHAGYDDSGMELIRVHNPMIHSPGETELEGVVDHSLLVGSMKSIGLELIKWNTFDDSELFEGIGKLLPSGVAGDMRRQFESKGWMYEITRLNEFYVFKAV